MWIALWNEVKSKVYEGRTKPSVISSSWDFLISGELCFLANKNPHPKKQFSIPENGERCFKCRIQHEWDCPGIYLNIFVAFFVFQFFFQINWLYIIWQDRMGFHWMLGVAGFQKMASLCTSGLHWNCSTYCMSGICWNYPPQVTVTTRMISFSIGNPYQPSFVIVTGWRVDWRYVFWVVKLQIFMFFTPFCWENDPIWLLEAANYCSFLVGGIEWF